MGRRDMLLLSILTLVTTIAWIVFDVYHARIDTTISPEIEQQLVPITPYFDKAVIEGIKKRQNVEPLEEGELQTRIPTIVQTQATGAARSQSATQSGGQ